MKIYIADLTYLEVDRYNTTVPLNAGYLASYVGANFPNASFKIFKDPLKLRESLLNNPPDLLALTQYAWNSNLSKAVLESVPGVGRQYPVVTGGPNFPIGRPDLMRQFFRHRPFLDVHISGEGEASFLRYVELLNKIGGPISGHTEHMPSSFWSYDVKKDSINNNPDIQIPTLDLDTIPSPYLTGILDVFLEDEHYAPIFETDRGCPFACSFCVWGQYTGSTVRKFDTARVFAELEYCADNAKNKIKQAIFANANFGILKRDLEIAAKLKSLNKEKGYPRKIYMYFTKNPNKNSLECAQMLRDQTGAMTLSLQSMDQNVLKNINRDNMTIEKYAGMTRDSKEKGIPTGSEIIYGLPGESYASYVDGLERLATEAEYIQQYAHFILWGAENSSDEFIRTHGIKTRKRPIWGAFGSFGDFHSIEYEDIVTETNDMSFDDWRKIRILHIFCQFLFTSPFKSLHHALKQAGQEPISLALKVRHDSKNWPSSFRNLVSDFVRRIDNEFISEENAARRTTREDILRLRDNEIALAPAFRAHFCARHRNVLDFRDYLCAAIPRFYGNLTSAERRAVMIHAIKISADCFITYDDFEPERRISYHFDLDKWHKDRDAPLSNFFSDKPIRYLLTAEKGLPAVWNATENSVSRLETAVYHLKMDTFGMSGDAVFGYQLKRIN